ncbi:MAG: mycoredoxin [Arcanobacterium sp.]
MTHITLYSTEWCGYCRMLRRELAAKKIDYKLVDIDVFEDAGRYLASITGGKRSIPTVEYSDGTVAINPSIREVETKLAELEA